MRVAFAIPTLHGGGAEFVCRTWVRELDSRGHEVIVYTYGLKQDTQEVGDRVVRRHFPVRSRVWKQLLLVPWLARQLRKDRPDALICMLTYSNLIGAVANGGTRTALVISERNMATMLAPRFGASGRIQRRIAKRFYRRADAAIAISHPVAADLIGGFGMPSSRTYVVPNPVMASTDDGSRGDLPARLTLGFVGRLLDQKRPWLFLDILDELRDRGVDADGVVVGDGPLRQALEAGARERGTRVSLVGWVEPWMQLAGRLDCLVHPSAVEGFGNVLVEAASVGIPCVASSAALGVADALVPGLTGELALDDSPASFVEAIGRALDASETDPRVRWLKRFGSQSSTETLLSVLDKAIQHRSAR